MRSIAGYIAGYCRESTMSTMSTAQKRALQNYRSRLTKRGMSRFEVLGLDTDRDLIRALARRLAEAGPDAAIRITVNRAVAGDSPRKGGILEALRRSPLASADLDLKRVRDTGRKVDL